MIGNTGFRNLGEQIGSAVAEQFTIIIALRSPHHRGSKTRGMATRSKLFLNF